MKSTLRPLTRGKVCYKKIANGASAHQFRENKRQPQSATLGQIINAIRRTSGRNAKGNTVTYTLDNMGNRVGEQVKDAQGNLQRSISRVYDALNRVQQVTGAAN